jgi:ABC-type lipoprotein release transport system permease subunit
MLGCLGGLALAALASKLLTGMLYDVSRFDLVTYFMVTVGVLVVAAVASALPATRAAHLDPMEVLRHD